MGSPALSQFSIGPGGANLSTSAGPSIPGLSGGPYTPNLSFISDMYDRLMKYKNQDQAMKQAAFNQSMQEHTEALAAKTAADNLAQKTGTEDAYYQDKTNKELAAPAPSKWVTVGGQTFLTTDPTSMDAIQRKAFLPGSAAMAPSAPISSAGQDTDVDRMMNALYGPSGPNYSDAATGQPPAGAAPPKKGQRTSSGGAYQPVDMYGGGYQPAGMYDPSTVPMDSGG